MNKVITINLHGRAFQLEEHGYNQLNDYLVDAHARLKADPDREEILADLEQALADKCESTISGTKNVVLDKEVTALLHDMGPVAEPDDADTKTKASKDTPRPPKRFFLIKDQSMVGGVCTGLAAYFNADVTIVRLLMLGLLFITSGAAAAGYIVVMMVAPTAKTPEEKATARGESFNSQELIGQARKKYAEVANKEHWEHVVEENRPAFSAAGAALRQLLRGTAGVIAAMAVLGLMVLTAVAVSGGLSLIATGLIFGIQFQPAIQPWILGAMIAAVYIVLAVPALFIASDTYRYSRSKPAQPRSWVGVLAVTIVTIAVSAVLTLFVATPSLQDNLRQYIQTMSSNDCIGFCSSDSPQIIQSSDR